MSANELENCLTLTKDCCVKEVKILSYASIDRDSQTATFCHNLMQLANAQNDINKDGVVTQVLELQAKSYWRCNLKGKKGYTWKNIINNTWK